MQRHAFYARLNPGYADRYLAAHRSMPNELVSAYRKAGIRDLRIFCHGDLLFLCLECEDLSAAMASLQNNPEELRWQSRIAPMLEAGDFHKLEQIFEMP